MFHQGTLQEGIVKAVEESKSVLCFVTDNGQESLKWENDWLQDQNVPNSIERQAIALRLDAGSQEAGYLAAFCPVAELPTILVIYQGQLQEQLKSGISKNDFTLRLLRSINRSQAAPIPSTSRASLQQTTNSNATSSFSSTRAATSQSTTPPSQPMSPSGSNQNQTNDSSTSTSSSERVRRPNEISYAQQQAQLKREAKEERERILRIIENDKIERREREEQRKRDALAQAQAESDPSSNTGEQLDLAAASSLSKTTQSSFKSSSSSSHPTTRLQVRLTDGSTLRNAFPSNTTVSAVRQWIDADRTDGGQPYTLKQILTPLPSRAIFDVQEKQTLAEFGLAPSAALVMVPAKGAASAYASRFASGSGAAGGVAGAGQQAVSRLWAWLVAVLMSVVAAIKTFLGLDGAQGQVGGQRAQGGAGGEGRTMGAAPRVGGKEQAGAASGSSSAGTASGGGADSGSGIRIRTLRDQRERDARDQQSELYNGNQLNFEPNRKDENNDEGDTQR